jgi:C_GCAxxG_C_C family probable redox protein
MSKYLEKAVALRQSVSPVYNCAQAVVIPFAKEAGLSEDMASKLSSNFGAGMKRAATCGSIAGGLIVLGMFGVDDAQTINEYYTRLKDNHQQYLDCANLLRINKEQGGEKKPHCDGMVFECVQLLEEILQKKGLIKTQEEITELGNPAKPRGKEGEEMLLRMNQSHSEVTDWALGFFDFKENDNVLDIGCGGGATLNKMSEKIAAGHLIGVDYSAVSVKMSTEYNREDIKNKKMEVIEASVELLPFKSGQFDKIVTVESFYFWPNHADNLKEVRRVLKKGGTFLIVADIYNKEGLSEHALENIKKYSMFNPTEEELKKMLEDAGFSNVKIHTKDGESWICVEGVA